MKKLRRGLLSGRVFAVAVLTVAIAAVPAGSVPHDNSRIPLPLLNRLSQSVVLNYYLANPDEAPSRLHRSLAAMNDAKESMGPTRGGGNANHNDLFNRDIFGLPQNEESVMACRTNTDFVLGGTNDYRGLIDPQGNFTGWHFSVDGGKSLTNEGLLPPVTLLRTPDREVPSGGDPVDFLADGDCAAYASSLAYNPNDPFGDANGIAVYKSSPEILATCEPFVEEEGDPTTDEDDLFVSNPACWPDRRLVAESEPGQFLDKEWLYVGTQNGVRYVWVTYTTFAIDFTAPLGFTGAEIHAVRCDENLVTCTEPIPISEANGPDVDVQFSDVTVGPDGRAYITWSQILGELPTDPAYPEQTFVHKIRVETAPGSAVFGPEHVIYEETRAIPFGGFLHANDFRIATYPKNEVAVMSDGSLRKFLVWDACKVRLLSFVCEEAEIKLSWSDDPDAAVWTEPIVVSKGGDNYFPAISVDRADRRNQDVALAWFTNYHDIDFHNMQDVVATSFDASKPRNTVYHRLTNSSNETEADPLLGGFFIGDYIETFIHGNRVWTHWNGNYRKVPLLGGFLNTEDQPVIPINQQDNFLSVHGPG